jgi:hypothetical protein
MGLVVSFIPQLFIRIEVVPVSTEQEAGWVVQLGWMLQKRKMACSQQKSNHNSSFVPPVA